MHGPYAPSVVVHGLSISLISNDANNYMGISVGVYNLVAAFVGRPGCKAAIGALHCREFCDVSLLRSFEGGASARLCHDCTTWCVNRDTQSESDNQLGNVIPVAPCLLCYR